MLLLLGLIALNFFYLQNWGWMIATMVRFPTDQSDATAIEYALLVVGSALVVISVMNGLGTNLNVKFTSINGSLR